MDLTEGNLLPAIVKLSAPAVFQAVLNNIYAFNNYLFVSYIQDKTEANTAASALSACVGLMVISFALHNIVPSGCTTYASQFR